MSGTTGRRHGGRSAAASGEHVVTMTINVADVDLELIDRALAEDVGAGDATVEATVPAGARGVATITQKEPGVISGLDVAEAVFLRLDPAARIERLGPEGEWREPPAPVLLVEGEAGALLTAERTALNFLGRLSGVATLTATVLRVSPTAAASTTAPGCTTSS